MRKIKQFLRHLARNRLLKKLTSASSEVYISIFHRERLANLNIMELVDANYEAAKNVFTGFVGYPGYTDDDLRICVKSITANETSNRNFLLAQNFVERLGFELMVVEKDENLKVLLTPGLELSRFLSSRSLDKKYPDVENLYARMK
jgi:hypothetical protein